MERDLPAGALEAAATLAAAWLQFRTDKSMPTDEYITSLYRSALQAVLAGRSGSLADAALERFVGATQAP